MSFRKQIILHLSLLASVLLIFEFTNIDLAVQDCFYLPNPHRWFIDRHEPVARFLFYTGPKILLIILGTVCIIGSILPARNARWKHLKPKFMLLALSLALVPLTIAALKRVSHVDTPVKSPVMTENYLT